MDIFVIPVRLLDPLFEALTSTENIHRSGARKGIVPTEPGIGSQVAVRMALP